MKKLLYILPLLGLMASGCSDDEVMSGAKQTEHLTLQFDAVIPVDEDVTRSIDGDPGVYEKFEKPHYLHTFVYVEQGDNKKVYHFQKTFSHDEAEAAWTLNGDRTCFHYTYDQTIDWASGNFQVGTNGANPTLRAYMVASHEAIVFGGKSLGNGASALLNGFTERDILDLTFSAQYNSSYINLRDIYSTPYNLSKSWTEIASPLTNRESYYGTLSQSLVDKKIFLVADTLYHTCAKVDFEWNTESIYQQNTTESIVLGENAGNDLYYEVGMSGYSNQSNGKTLKVNSWGKSSTANFSNGEVTFTNPSVVNNWEAQFAIDGDTYAQGSDMIMEIRAKASAEMNLSAGFQNTDGFKGCGDFPVIPLTTEYQTFRLRRTVTGDANRLLFSYGSFAGSVTVDYINLYKYTVNGNTLPLTGYIFRPTENVSGTSYTGTYSKLLLGVSESNGQAAPTPILSYDRASELPDGISIRGTTAMGTAKIHTNKDNVNCIQLKNGYSKDNPNYIKLSPAGGFKAGDIIKIAGFFNNESSRNSAIDLYASADGMTNCNVLFSSEQYINGRLVNDEPRVDSYTLTSNYNELYIGRKKNDNVTTTNVCYIEVSRSVNSKTVSPAATDQNYYTERTPGNKWSGRAYTYVIQPERDVVDYVFTTSAGRSTAGSLDPKQNIRLEGCMSNVFPSWYKMNVKIKERNE